MIPVEQGHLFINLTGISPLEWKKHGIKSSVIATNFPQFISH
jgi:hypothetical protein